MDPGCTSLLMRRANNSSGITTNVMDEADIHELQQNARCGDTIAAKKYPETGGYLLDYITTTFYYLPVPITVCCSKGC